MGVYQQALEPQPKPTTRRMWNIAQAAVRGTEVPAMQTQWCWAASCCQEQEDQDQLHAVGE